MTYEEECFKIHLAHEGQMRAFMHSVVIGLLSKSNNKIPLTKEEILTYDELIRFFGQEARTRRLIAESTTQEAQEKLERGNANDNDVDKDS